MLQLSAVLPLAKGLGQYSWTMLAVLDLKTHSLPVAIPHYTTVDMGKMLVFDANLVRLTFCTYFHTSTTSSIGEGMAELSVFNPRCACAARVTVVNPRRTCAKGLSYSSVCVSVGPSAGANLGTGTSRCLTEGTSGLSSTFFTTFSLKVRKLEVL